MASVEAAFILCIMFAAAVTSMIVNALLDSLMGCVYDWGSDFPYPDETTLKAAFNEISISLRGMADQAVSIESLETLKPVMVLHTRAARSTSAWCLVVFPRTDPFYSTW